MLKRIVLTSVLGLAAICAAAAPGAAQDYPNKPVRIIVPFAAGGTVDIIGRLLADRFKETLGQPFVVDNRVGGAGNLGTDMAAKAAPDGYTLVLGAANTHAINFSLFSKPTFDPVKDFTAISLICLTPNMMAVSNTVPAGTVQEFIAFAKANPGKVNYGSIGNGSTQHMIAELFKKQYGVEMSHITYRGQPQLVQDLISGQVHVSFNNISNLQGQVEAGQLKGLAVTLPQRWPALPNVPTFAEAGTPNFEFSSWVAFFGPAGLPPAIVAILNRETLAALKVDDIRNKIAALGTVIVGNSAAEADAFVKKEVAAWRQVVDAAGVKID